MKKIIALITVLAFAGCATTQATHKDEFTDVISLAGNVYQVYSGGTTRESQEKVFIRGLIRCANVSLNNGCQYFYLLDYQGNVSTSYQYIPQIQTTTYDFTKSPLGSTVHGTSRTYGSTGFYKQKYSYESVFWIQPVNEPDEELGNPYIAQSVLDVLYPKLEEMEKRDQNRETGRIVAIAALSAAALITLLVWASYDPSPEYP